MKLFYLISAVAVGILILVISFAQFGASCSWYLYSATTPALVVLLQMSLLGMIVGGLLVLFWKTRGTSDEEEDDE